MISIDPLTWARMAILGYLLTISMETPILFFGLANRYSLKQKLFAGAFLTACSYPFVAVFFPMIWDPYENYNTYIVVSEIFAPLSECVIFAWLFQRRKPGLTLKQRMFDFAAIIAANLFSYLFGEFLKGSGLQL